MPEPIAEEPCIPLGDYGQGDEEWLKVDWRQHLRRVELPGAQVNYVDIGEGEPIVFVHGLISCWQTWLENLPHFARRYRAIALDLPGFGRSPMPSWPIDIPSYGRLLHDFCEKLGIDRSPMLVGNSLGGFVAAEAVTAAPGRFDRLVLVSAAGIVNTWRPEQRAVATTLAWKSFAAIFGISRMKAMLRRPRWGQLMIGPFVRYPSRLREELLYEQVIGSVPSPAFGDALHATLSHDIRDRLPRIAIPVLIAWGFNDRIIPVQAALSYRRRIPDSRLEIFERTGHLLQLERPARFNALLDEFLVS